MLKSLRARTAFILESIALRGPVYRVGMILCLVGWITLGGGLCLAIFEGGSQVGSHLWWALLRVSDSGYLQDDGGSGFRALLSIMLSLCGTAFLFGGVAAVMTQWLSSKLERIGEGAHPVFYQKHVVLLGWSDRAVHVIRELLGRNPRERIVVLSEDPVHDVSARLSLVLSRRASGRVVVRRGLPFEPHHLRRAAIADASSVIFPEFDLAAEDAEGRGTQWLRWLAALRAVGLGVEERRGDSEASPPRVIVELGQLHLKGMAQRLLPSADFFNGDKLIAQRLVESLNLRDDQSLLAARVLVIGWSGVGPDLLKRLYAVGQGIAVDLLAEDSHRPLVDRFFEQQKGSGHDLNYQVVSTPELALGLRTVSLAPYHRFVFLAERGALGARLADDVTLTRVLLLDERMDELHESAQVTVELLDEASVSIFQDPRIVQVVTPAEVGRALAQLLI